MAGKWQQGAQRRHGAMTCTRQGLLGLLCCQQRLLLLLSCADSLP